MSDLFDIAREAIELRKATLTEESNALAVQIEDLERRISPLHAKHAGIISRLAEVELLLAAVNQAPAAEVKRERAKPGEIETAIRAHLAAGYPLNAEAIASYSTQKIDSVRVVLRRLVSLGEIVEDHGTYMLPRKDAAE